MKTYTRREAMIRMLEMPGHKMKSKSVVFHFCDECNKFMLHDRDVADMSSPYWSEEFTDYIEPFKLDFDWSCLPKWARWIALDENGDWFWYQAEPSNEVMSEFGEQEWFDPLHASSGEVPNEYKPKNYAGDWKDSLFERPADDQ